MKLLPRLLLLVALALLLPEQGFAHGALRRSVPASGDTLSVSPRELRLTFNEAVEVAVARIMLTGPEGPVALGPLALSADSPQVLLAGIRGPLVAGTYTVAWQVAGADGHPVRGTYSFRIAPGAAGLAPPPPPAATPTEGEAPPAEHHQPETFPEGPGFGAESPLYAAVRWLTFLGVLGVVGVVAFRLLVLAGVARQAPGVAPGLVDTAGARAARLGVALAAVAALAAVLRLYAQSYALHGAGALHAGRIVTILTDTTWGRGWLLQAAGTVLALVGFALARGRAAGWALAALGALALAFAPGLSGHAAAVAERTTLAVLADGLHVVGAGGWLGSLLAVVAVGVPAALRLAPGERGGAVAALVNAFSPTALLFAGVVVATGLFASWLHLGSFSALWESGYGRTLLLKLAVLSVVFGTGAYNWLRVKPALGSEAAAGRLRRSATLELAVGVVVLAITAVLVATSPPGEM